jgi:hypothetical protein
MAFFYADENFDYGVVERLRVLGHDVLVVLAFEDRREFISHSYFQTKPRLPVRR